MKRCDDLWAIVLVLIVTMLAVGRVVYYALTYGQ
jgi:hypothetical protein